MKAFFDKVVTKSLLMALVLLVSFYLLYQSRFFLADVLWQSKNIDNYTLAVQTQEEFSLDKVVTTCHYILAVQKEEIEIGDISCEHNSKHKLTYSGSEMTIPGLIRLAKTLQSNEPFFKIANKDFSASIDWRYGFPSKLFYEKNNEFYQVTITVEDFKVYK